MKQKIVALVPMRHDSERVKQKNYREFNGKPLFYWILNTLCQCQSIDSVYINTDSPVIKENAPKIDTKINIIDRPQNLRAGEIPMNDILLYDMTKVEADFYLQTHSTNPLLKAETVEKAIQTFLAAKGKDSLFGVTRIQARLWTKDAKAINHDPKVLLRTQDLEPVFEENSNIYIFTKKNLIERKNRIGKNPVLFEIPRQEAWDIDTESDFMIAELLHRIYFK